MGSKIKPRFCLCGSRNLGQCRRGEVKSYLCNDCGYVFPKKDVLRQIPTRWQKIRFNHWTYKRFCKTFDEELKSL